MIYFRIEFSVRVSCVSVVSVNGMFNLAPSTFEALRLQLAWLFSRLLTSQMEIVDARVFATGKTACCCVVSVVFPETAESRARDEICFRRNTRSTCFAIILDALARSRSTYFNRANQPSRFSRASERACVFNSKQFDITANEAEEKARCWYFNSMRKTASDSNSTKYWSARFSQKIIPESI